MRRPHLILLAAPLVAGLFALAAPPAARAQAFTVRLPVRTPPISRVKILLETNADPSAATLAVDGSAPFGISCVFRTVNSDRFKFTRVTGTNNVLIELVNRSRVPGPDLSVDINPGAGDKIFQLNYTGPGVDGFRLVGYSVAAPHGVMMAQIFDPTKDMRRVNQTPPLFDANPPGANRGRLPLDLILVLDKSGSMDWEVPNTPGEVRWLVLKESLSQMIDIWKTEGLAPWTTTGGTDLSADRIGVVFFDSDSDPADASPPGITWVARGAPMMMPHPWDTGVMGLVNSKNPGGGTAMGRGLRKGIVSFEVETGSAACAGGVAPASNASDPVVILMTDGEQNVAPLIVEDAGAMKLEFSSNPTAMPTPTPTLSALGARGIPVISVGIRPPGDPTATLLDNVSKQTAGTSFLPSTAFGMAQTFAQGLVEAMKGNTLSIISRGQDTLPAGTSAGGTTQDTLDQSVRRAVYVLGWSGGRNANALDLEVFAPGSTKPVAPAERHDSPFHTVQAFDIPATGPVGDWGVRVVRQANAVGTAGFAVPYHLSTYAYEGRLAYRIHFSRQRPGTGETLVMGVEVSYDGKPLTGLGNAITARIERPGDGMGTLLHDREVSADVLGTERPGGNGDTTDPLQRKITHLSGTTDLLKRIEPQQLPNVFTLRDDGNASTGDERANDGVYSTAFSDSTRPGLYRFRVALEWNDARTGRVRRIETLERDVKVTPDPGASLVSASTLDRGSSTVTVVPRDRFNNYLGPGRAHLIRVASSAGTVGAAVDRRQTGDYGFNLTGVPAGTDPVITVVVDGVKIREDELSDLVVGPTPTPDDIPAPASEKRWGISLHGGASIPHGVFNNILGVGPNVGADLEYRFTDHFSLEGIYTYHRFRGDSFGPFSFDDLNLHQLSLNGKVYAPGTTVRPFFNFGGGAYVFHPGADVNGGLNVGGGLQFNVTRTFAVEGAYNYHNVFTGGSDFRFSTVQAGVRFRF